MIIDAWAQHPTAISRPMEAVREIRRCVRERAAEGSVALLVDPLSRSITCSTTSVLVSATTPQARRSF